MNVSVVIPTYNERENIRILIPEIFRIFKENKIDGSVIVVDDSSPDGTSDEVKELLSTYNVVLISRRKKSGIGSAYICGFKEALKDSDIIFEMDADLSHNPGSIPEFIENLNGFDVVLGSRYIPGGRIKGWNFYRTAVSKTGNFISRGLLNMNINDITTGYRAYRKETLKSIGLDSIKSDGYAFQAEILYRIAKNGAAIKEIPIIFTDRKKGKSKLSKAEILWFFATCLRFFIDRVKNRLTRKHIRMK